MTSQLLSIKQSLHNGGPLSSGQIYKRIHDNGMKLVAAHDLAMVREILPRMIIMDEGRIVADGLTDKLMEDRDLLEAHGLEKP